jgi:hypothetical protein
MLWYKHLSASGNDPDIDDSVSKFGPAGYYVFFRTLEVMAREFDVKKPGFNRFSVEFFRKKFRISWQKTVKILNFFDQRKRIFMKHCELDGMPAIELNCPKLKKLCDEYTAKQIRILSGQNPDTIRTLSVTETETETETEYKRTIKALETRCLELNKMAECDAINFNGHVFFNDLFNKNNCPPGLAVEVADGLLKAWQSKTINKNPWAYGTGIYKTKKQHYNEKQHIKQALEFKKHWAASPKLKKLIGGIG